MQSRQHIGRCKGLPIAFDYFKTYFKKYNVFILRKDIYVAIKDLENEDGE